MRCNEALRRAPLFCAFCFLLAAQAASAQQSNSVTATVDIKGGAAGSAEKSTKKQLDLSEVVVWLVPLDREMSSPKPPASRAQIVQHHKAFEPHLMVVPVGSTVDFPNRDPFFHNVFSLFDGKRFDLGLYEAGASNSVKFDRVGVSLLFCNIHPEMNGVVIALNTPYYSVSDSAGNVSIKDVPDGRYELHAWYGRSLPEHLKSLTHAVVISASSRNLGVLNIPEDPGFSLSHKNKFGQDYEPPPAAGYSKP